MTIDQLVATGASIGACMSAIAAFLTVRQVSKQREASYRPELVISRTVFECGLNTASSKSIPDNWMKKDIDQKDIDFLQSFTVPLRNVGLGAAKEVSVKWSFPIEELVANVNKLAQESLTPAYFEYKNEILSLKSDSLGASTSMWMNQQKATIDFVLPAPIDQTPVELVIPRAFIQLVSAFIHFSGKTDRFNHLEKIAILTVDLDYLDIGGKKHKSKFALNTTIIMVVNKGEAFSGQIESTNSV